MEVSPQIVGYFVSILIGLGGTIIGIICAKIKSKYINNDTVYTIIESLMIQAEKSGFNGAEKKQSVINKFVAWSERHKIKISIEDVSGIIDSFMAVANNVNVREKTIISSDEKSQSTNNETLIKLESKVNDLIKMLGVK